MYYITTGVHSYDFLYSIYKVSLLLITWKLCSFRKGILNQNVSFWHILEKLLVTKFFRKATNSHHQKGNVHQYQVGIQVFTPQYHFVEKIFMFALVAKLQTERQFDQYLESRVYRHMGKASILAGTHTQFNSNSTVSCTHFQINI